MPEPPLLLPLVPSPEPVPPCPGALPRQPDSRIVVAKASVLRIVRPLLRRCNATHGPAVACTQLREITPGRCAPAGACTPTSLRRWTGTHAGAWRRLPTRRRRLFAPRTLAVERLSNA